MTPTHVFGFGAADYAAAQGWDDVAVLDRMAGPGGVSGNDGVAREILVMPGEYRSTDFFLGNRARVRVIGLPGARLIGDSLGGSRMESLEVYGLELINCPVGIAHNAKNASTYLRVEGCRFSDWGKEQNAIGNPNTATSPGCTSVIEILGNTFIEVGGLGNTKHTMYVEGRPDSTLRVQGNVFCGGRGCSAIKSTCLRNEIRDNVFDTIGPTGLTIHTPVDVVSCSETIVTRNRFRLWFPDDYGKRSKGRKGTFTAGIFFRSRRNLNGSDIPAYPEASWDPPTASTGAHQRGDPGGGFDGTSATFANPAFWDAVRAADRTDPANPFAYRHWVSDNSLEYQVHPDGTPSRQVKLLRDDGTIPIEELAQFGAPTRVLRNMPNWSERSVNFLYGNTLPPSMSLDDACDVTNSGYITVVEAGAIWPRTEPHHFPLVVNVPPVYSQPAKPAWFKD